MGLIYLAATDRPERSLRGCWMRDSRVMTTTRIAEPADGGPPSATLGRACEEYRSWEPSNWGCVQARTLVPRRRRGPDHGRCRIGREPGV
jgi:hypothetical protein